MDAQPPANPARLDWVDAAKGLGIILVVIGHVTTGPKVLGAGVEWWIFLFHMPLFFMLSGVVQKPEPAAAVVRKKFRSLMVPYFAYLALIGLPLAFGKFLLGGEGLVPRLRELAEALARLAYGGGAIYGVFAAYWYVPCLFIAQAAYAYAAGKAGGDRTRGFLLFLLACTAFAYAYSRFGQGLWTPLDAAVAPAAILLLWLGRTLPWRNLRAPGWLLFDAAAIAAAIVLGERGVGFAIGMKSGYIGPPIAGLALAVALSHLTLLATVGLVKVPGVRPLLLALGRATVPILFLHEAVNFGLRALGWTSGWAIVLPALVLPYLFYLLARSHDGARRLFLGESSPARALRPATAAA